MTYKGYSIGMIEWDEGSGSIHGRVALSRGIATFVGTTASEAIQAFRDSVEHYLAVCSEHGIEPEVPDSELVASSTLE